MNNLFRFFVRYHIFILFILLEIVALSLIGRSSAYHRGAFNLVSSNFIGSIYDRVDRIKSSYTRIDKIYEIEQQNSKLHQEIVSLRERCERLLLSQNDSPYLYSPFIVEDTTEVEYDFILAKVVKNSVDLANNTIVINKGSESGIVPDLAVYGPKGVVGVVTTVSENYSLVISLLNQKYSISAKIDGDNYFGTIVWDGSDYRYATLKNIPIQADVIAGRNIITSGYSAIFPAGMNIGTIESFEPNEDGIFYDVTVKLSTDFRSIDFINVIKIQDKEDILNLLQEGKDEK